MFELLVEYFPRLQVIAYSPPGWGRTLLIGLLATLHIAFGAYLLGIVVGLAGALGKINGGPVLRFGLEVYTTLFRAVPELVLILLLYYAGTGLLNSVLESLGFAAVDISGLAAGIWVLGIVQGAYSTEVIRGAILAVPKGQIEAAQAYGMSSALALRRIIIPAMVPLALPGMSNLWLIVTKNTALLAVVGFSELALTTKQAGAGTREYLILFITAGILYLCVTLVSNVFFNWLEQRSRRGQQSLGEV